MQDPQFSRYATLVSELALPVLRGLEDGGSGSVRLAAAAGRLLLEDDPAQFERLAAGLGRLAAVGAAWREGQPLPRLADDHGSRRTAYYLLALHLHLAAFALRYEALPARRWGACEGALEAAIRPVRAVEAYADATPPPAALPQVFWQALCLSEYAALTHRDVDQEIVQGVVFQALRLGPAEGPLHEQGVDTTIDTWTYAELVGLHALANLALLRRHQPWAARVEQAARYHLEMTQPDFITTEPWAVFAFAWTPATRSFADQQLHDARSQPATTAGGGLSAVAALLLADAGWALGRFRR